MPQDKTKKTVQEEVPGEDFELVIPVTEEEYEKATSKFVVFPPNARKGDVKFLGVEIGMIDWDQVGVSMKVPVTVIEDGIDFGKQEKISFGVKPEGIWKGRELYKAIMGTEMPMKAGADGVKRPAIRPMEIAGKKANGMWQIVEGKKGGVGEATLYPKLVSILPAGPKPKAENLGI